MVHCGGSSFLYIGKIGKDGEALTGNIAAYEKTPMDQLEKEKLASR